MAVTRETLRLAAGLQLMVNGHLSESTRLMAVAWARAWRQVQAEWKAVTEQLVADGVKPSRRTLARLRNVRAAANTTQELLDELVGETRGMLVGSNRDVIERTIRAQARLVASQLPRGSAARELANAAGPVPNRQLEAIVRRSTQQVTSLLRPLSAEATEAMLDQLVGGAARGEHPRRVAAAMLNQVQQQFEGGLVRAVVIARTEGMDAHRAAGMVAQNQHRDVLSGWQWLAALTTRTCPACWSKHGSIHDLDEFGPDGHQQCRCARVPITKSWDQLGISVPESPSLIRPGEQEFARLPARDQLAIMGPTRLQALRSGTALWDELAQTRANPGWRDAVYVRPVADFRPRMNRSA